jgi:uncharacterized membrane protein YuzA (DUF378 family)
MNMCKDCGNGKCGGHGCGTGKIAKILMIIGGLNWGLIGLGGFLGMDLNVVHMVLGRAPSVEWIVYLLVGVAALIKIFGCRCKSCMPEVPAGGMK